MGVGVGIMAAVGSGFLGAVTGAASIIGSAVSVGGIISGALATIASTAMGMLASISGIITGPLGPVLGPIVAQIVMELAVKAVVAIAKKLGIIKEDEEVDKVGYRVEESVNHDDWKKREDFSSTKEWLEYLEEMIPDEEIDKEKLRMNRVRYESVGTATLVKGWEENVGIYIPSDFLTEIGRSNLDEKEIQVIVDAFKTAGLNQVDLHKYLQGTLSGVLMDKITEALMGSYKSVYPDKTEHDITMRINELRTNSRNDQVLKEKYKKEIDYRKKHPEEYRDYFNNGNE